MSILDGKNPGHLTRTVVTEGMGINDIITSGIGNFTSIRIKDGKGRILYDGHNTTVLGGREAQLEELFGLTKNTTQHLTLNTLLGITHTSTSDVFKNSIARSCSYFMAGKGASSTTNPNKVYSPKNYETNLYDPIPFRMVPVSSDLSSSDQEQYRLRKIVSVSGTDYAAYYAKKFTPGSLVLEYNDAEYTPLASDTIPVDEGDTSHRLSGGSVLCYIQFFLNIEATELKEYFRITNGSLDGASMSEIGLVYGADIANTSDSNRMELAAAELLAKITSAKVSMADEGDSRQIEYRIYAR